MIYVISSKNVYAAKRIEHEARNMEQALRIMDLKGLIACNFKVLAHRGDTLYIRNPYLRGKPDYLPYIIKLAKSFKAQGGRVVDGNITKGDLGLGKWVDYQKLMKAGLHIPRTDKFSIFNFQFSKNFQYPISNIQFPLIIKWIYGMKAKGTFLISSDKDLKRIPSDISKKEFMVQEYIGADYEYKVITVGYKALPIVLRFKFNKKLGRVDFTSHSFLLLDRGSPFIAWRKWGDLEGGGWEGVKKVVSIAEKASKTLGRELAKVDILEKAGKFYVLEVNRFPGLESFEKLTKYNAVREFLKYSI